MLFDTHTHLDAAEFDNDREEVIQRALDAGVTRMVNIGFNRETIPTTMELVEKYDFIYGAVGWHPVDAITMKDGDLEWIASLCEHEKVVAIGEIGLDYHWDTSPKDIQHTVLRRQIGLAREISMPITILIFTNQLFTTTTITGEREAANGIISRQNITNS